MASSCLTTPILPPHFHSAKSSPTRSKCQLIKVRPISASIFDERRRKPLSSIFDKGRKPSPPNQPSESQMTLVPPPETSQMELISPPDDQAASTTLPIREIPGDYGPPIVGAIKDRLDYFYNQGDIKFFQSRIDKYNSTVFRVNMVPGPFISSLYEVIAILNGKTYPVLFDSSRVDKTDLFVGNFTPSKDLTGGYRILGYHDPSEPKHTTLKNLIFYMLKYRCQQILPEFHKTYTELFETLEKEIGLKGKASFNDLNERFNFRFLARAYLGKDPEDTELGSQGPKLINIWMLFHLAPLFSLGLPQAVEEAVLHTNPLPPALVKGSYDKLYNFFQEAAAGPLLDEAEKMGITREEACHNILFSTCFNAYGGFKVLIPTLLKWIGLGGIELQTKLAQEIRSAVKANDGKITLAAMEKMPLVKSVVYEALRIEPPVPFQCARAKKDLLLESHDAAFKVKKGEILFGFQPFATKDPKIFDKPEEFVADRFVGEGEKLLKHVMWSNGLETEDPSVSNKQCAGKDFSILVGRLLVVEFFLRYDTYEFVLGKALVGSTVTLTSLTKADY